MQRLKVLIIIPAYNEQARLPEVLRKLAETSSHSVMVVDDASADATVNMAKIEGFPVVSLPLNLGIGGAVKAGYKYAIENGFDIAVQFDADGQHNPHQLDDLLQPIVMNEAEMVIGSRFIAKQGYQSEKLRRLGIRFFSFLTSIIIGYRITDVTSGFRAVGGNLLADFARYYPVDFPDAAAIILAKTLGYRIVEKPVIMAPRTTGASSFNFARKLSYPVKTFISIMAAALRSKRYNRS